MSGGYTALVYSNLKVIAEAVLAITILHTAPLNFVMLQEINQAASYTVKFWAMI